MKPFRLVSDFSPTGDQPEAIEKLVEGLRRGYRFQTLLGVTGSGKTFTVANVIERVQRPTLVISHNKTLAAQLAAEFKAFFPHNAVEYFVSYYDYYQPEAYVPQKDLYIEKDASINEEIDRLRHRTTQALLTRRDVIVVASVSAIYGLGSPLEYERASLKLRRGMELTRRELLSKLISMQYQRGMAPEKGRFRLRGATFDVGTVEERVLRVEIEGGVLRSLRYLDPVTYTTVEDVEQALIFPATHYNIAQEGLEGILKEIERDLQRQVEFFKRQGKVVEAERLRRRVLYDIEMIREMGYCTGIENYSRYFDGRLPGEPPYTLLDFFPSDYLVVIDESHVTIPQLQAMYRGDRSRKKNLVDYGFRLPAAYDNRPLTFEEFLERVGQVIFTTATPGPFEREVSSQIVEQIIRPTGLVDPELIVRPTEGQIEDLIGEIRERKKRGERVLVTTLTKRLAETLTDYLREMGLSVNYLHSDVETLERVEILKALREGKYDVVVGINLLREGLDLPEVSLVAILDADKEGFLRSETALIQTIGRAARHVNGQVIMYADEVTDSMKRAIEETERRRRIQMEYNRRHGITPKGIKKEIRTILKETPMVEEGERLPAGELKRVIEDLQREMRRAAKELRFEEAARIRDEIRRLKGDV
ncbi:MAG TPA: excinuclease ABC subunit UvrB [Euryarchaeota archaeon]|nr:excinuclease ABC subunit UvrB [Euryarchaeota archaeon]